MIIGNTDFKSLDELIANKELEQETDKYCSDFLNYMLKNGSADCPFFPITKKYNEPCFFSSYKKLKESAS